VRTSRGNIPALLRRRLRRDTRQRARAASGVRWGEARETCALRWVHSGLRGGNPLLRSTTIANANPRGAYRTRRRLWLARAAS